MLRGKSYAEHFETHNSIIDGQSVAVLPPLLESLSWKEGETWFDHGCGTGRTGLKYFVPYAEKYGAKMYGLDPSESMIHLAREKYSHPAVEYVQSNILDANCPLGTTRFDKIFSIRAIMLDSEYRKTLAKLYELLVPGGSLVLIIISKSNLFDCHGYVKRLDKWSKHFGKEHLVVPDWLNGSDPSTADYQPHFRQLLEGIGFKVMGAETVPRTFTFTSEAECAEFYVSASPAPHETQLEHDTHRRDVYDAFNKCLDSKQVPGMGGGVKVKVADGGGGGGYKIEYEMINFVLEKPTN